MEKKPFLSLNSTYVSILIHTIIWLCILFFPFLFFNIQITLPFFILRICIPTLLLASLFYINMFILMPRFLRTKKYWSFIISAFAIISFITIIDLSTERYYFRSFRHSLISPDPLISWRLQNKMADSLISPRNREFYMNPGGKMPIPGEGGGPGRGPSRFGLIGPGVSRTILLSLLALAISSSLKVTGEWFKNERQKKEMENEKLSSELVFLKSQVNPHFFFNTLNNIYSLANSKSDDAPIAIAKLSQLMRYMLYESNVRVVPLSREIEYLNNFIDLQRLRFRDNIKISFTIEGETDDKMIEPMLFIPFVENAFKHGPGLQPNPSIGIFLRTSEQQLYFSVDNTFEKNESKQADTNSGIGLQNISRRLNLLYPDNHKLIIKEQDNIFKVELTLTLS